MHFLRKGEADHWLQQAAGKHRACVTVTVDGDRVIVKDGSIGVCKRDTLFVPLPDRFKVTGPDGKLVKPTRGSRFWISIETIDPYHIILEAPHLPL